jgi:hypothetical protein
VFFFNFVYRLSKKFEIQILERNYVCFMFHLTTLDVAQSLTSIHRPIDEY